MPRIDLTDEERAALADVAREYLRTQRYSLAPRLAPIKSALLKLARRWPTLGNTYQYPQRPFHVERNTLPTTVNFLGDGPSVRGRVERQLLDEER